MDPATLGIGIAVTVVIAAVVAIVTMFGFGGETEYEQQIARQKEILLDESKTKSTDKKKVKTEKKKKVKTRAEGGEHISGSEFEVESGKDEVENGRGVESASADELSHAHIEYDPDPVIIDATTAAPTLSKTAKKNRKVTPVKSILVNREEAPLVRSEDAAIAETVYSETAPPKDDLELKHGKSKKFGKKDKGKQTHVAVEEPAVPVVDEIVVPVQAKSQSTAPPPPQVVEEMVVATSGTAVNSAPPTSSRKNKVKSGNTGSVGAGKAGNDLSKVIDIVQQAPLTRDELQTLVESILARQESEDSWTTKSARPDPIAMLRKQLEEALKALTDEQSNVASAQAKIKEISVKWTAAEKMSSGLTAQIQELQKQNQKLNAEIKTVTDGGYQDRQKVEQQKEIINQLSEENQRLKQSVANTDEVTQMQNQVRTLSAEKQTWSVQSAESERLLTDSRHELARVQESQKVVDAEKAELKKRCDELGQKLAQADTLSLEAQNRAKENEKNNKNLQDHIRSQQKDKDNEIQALKDELTMAKELQLQAPSTNGNHGNGDSTNDLADVTELEGRITKLEQCVQDKDSQLTNLNKQLTVTRTSQTELAALKQRSAEEADQRKAIDVQIAALQTQAQTLKDKNNELRRKNWGLVESLDKVESSSLLKGATERDLEEKVCTINLLKDSNSKLQAQNNDLQERSAQMSSLTDEVSLLKKQVNEAKAGLDIKDSTISQLEESLQSERQKVSATESECRDILEKEFNRTVKTLSNEHKELVEQLRSEISDKQGAINALDISVQDQEAVIGNLTECKTTATTDVRELNEQISVLNKELQTLRSANTDREAEALETEHATSLHQYRSSLTRVESMLDRLGVRVQEEHQKITVKLSSKDDELSIARQQLADAVKQLAESCHSNESTSAAESSQVSGLTSQLEESKQKLDHLEKILVDQSSNSKAEAAAMASSGGGDDKGTSV